MIINNAGKALLTLAGLVLQCNAPAPLPPPPVGVTISGYTAIGAGQNAWKWDTQSFVAATLGGNAVIEGDQYTRFVVIVPDGCGYLDIEAVPTQSSGLAIGCSVDYAIDGATSDFSLQYATANTRQTLRLTVPGTGSRTVELYEQRTYITGITPQTTATVMPAAAHASSAVYFGASGTEGYYSYNPDPGHFTSGVQVLLYSWVGRMKTSRRFDASYVVAFDGYGFQNFVASPSPATCAAFVTTYVVPRCTGTTEQVVVYEFGAGEYLNAAWTAAQITLYYGYLAAATRAALPSARVVFKTPIVEGSPAEGTVNAAGETQQSIRNAIAAVQITYNFVQITVGYNGGALPAESDSTSNLQDGKHFNAVAQRDKAFPYMHSVL